MDDRYCRLAREYNVSIQHGELGIAFNRLIDMADVRKEEGCAADEMKLLMLAFNLKTNGCSGDLKIHSCFAERIVSCNERFGAGEHEVTQLFYDTVAEDSTPKRIMTLNDNIYLFLLVANGKTETAQEILEQFVES